MSEQLGNCDFNNVFFKTFDDMFNSISEYLKIDELYNMVSPDDTNNIVHDYDRLSIDKSKTRKELESGLVLYLSIMVKPKQYIDVYVQSIPFSDGYVVSRVGSPYCVG
jgi:hypothetical protein